MFDYAALDAVSAAVREGSFERAASALSVTPSAISQRIKGLEERLGAVLVTRTTPVQATEIGARLCAHVDQVKLLEADVVGLMPGLGGDRSRTPVMRIAVNADSLSTWFPAAAQRFASLTSATLDLVLDDEAHTADRLRSGEVLAAVTADPLTVPGCRTHELGSLTYLATASPDFIARFFPNGVEPDAFSVAPMLRFDRRDDLQARWLREALGTTASPPVHWTPATQGMLDMALAGLGWAMTPAQLALPHLANGRLVELLPGRRLAVPLYWQRTRLAAGLIDQLTAAVREGAKTALQTQAT
jgi:LysR family transcriptional regulator (chromosome initiation inhibitor)